MDENGISAVVGGVLVFAIIMVSIAGFLLWGAPAIQDLGDRALYEQVIVQFRELDSAIGSLVSAGSGTQGKWTPGIDRGSILFEPRGDRFLIETDESGTFDATLYAWEDFDQWFLVKVASPTSTTTFGVRAWRIEGSGEVELHVNQTNTDAVAIPGPALTLGCTITATGCARGASGSNPCATAAQNLNRTLAPATYKAICLWDNQTKAAQPIQNVVLKVSFYADGTRISTFWLVDSGVIEYVHPTPQFLRRVYYESGTVWRQEPTLRVDGDLSVNPPQVSATGSNQFLRLLSVVRAEGGGSLSSLATYYFTAVSNVALAQLGNFTTLRLYVDGTLRPGWLGSLTNTAAGFDYAYATETAETSLWPTAYVSRSGSSLPFALSLHLTRIGIQT